jgi:hypothetical protein
MLEKSETFTRNIFMVIFIFSAIESYFKLDWINQKSPYFFWPFSLLIFSNIILQIINFIKKKKRKRDNAINA